MIHEFALEPALLTNWPSFRYFTEKFGVPQGRLISRYPKRWRKLVYEGLGECGPLERKKIEEGLARIRERMQRRPNSLWNSELDWLSNAEIEHARKPFRAIVASSNPRNSGSVLIGDDLDETQALWQIERTISISRDATTMAQCVAPLLRIATQVLLVDPHFSPQWPRWQRSLGAFLNAILAGRDGTPPVRVEFHTSGDGDEKPTAAQFAADCTRYLSGIIPAGLELRIVRWMQRAGGKQLHNRYILTDIGGVSFHTSLDEGQPGGNGRRGPLGCRSVSAPMDPV